MNGKIFADTSIIVYAHTSSENDKRDKVVEMLDNANLVISTQVVKEFINIMVRKFSQPILGVKAQIDAIASIAIVVNEDLELIDSAIEINQTYKYRFYDCLIIAAALRANCDTLLSEDMQHEQVIEGTLKIVNPFA
jgi:predicted nucleic acid-binding protein